MAYTPDPTDTSQPVESVFAKTAAAEFRALKAYIQTIVSGGGTGVATPGQIALFTGNTPLAGWLELNGDVKLRADYPNLWANAQALGAVVAEAAWNNSPGSFSSGDLATTFRLPDYRGVFVRGFNHGKAVSSADPGRAAGSIQLGTLVFNTGSSGGTSLVPQSGSDVNLTDETVSSAATYNIITPIGGSTQLVNFERVRPTNVPAMYCVKT